MTDMFTAALVSRLFTLRTAYATEQAMTADMDHRKILAGYLVVLADASRRVASDDALYDYAALIADGCESYLAFVVRERLTA